MKVGDVVEYREGYEFVGKRPTDKLIFVGEIVRETKTLWFVRPDGSRSEYAFKKATLEQHPRRTSSLRYITLKEVST